MPRDAVELYKKYLERGRSEHKIRSKIKTGRHWYGLPKYFRPRKTWLSNRNEGQQYDLDVAMWYGAFERSPADIKGLMARIFGILAYGGLLFKDGDGVWKRWSDYDIPLAAALSHGGRVMVQLPESDNEDFWHWLWGNVPVQTRFAATHGVLFLPTSEDGLPDNQSKQIKEVKKNHNVRQYGVNIGMGGIGNINPWSGVKIDAIGEHGHLYIGYRAPSRTMVGVLLVGCEGSAPIDMYRGGLHGFAKDQSGHRHTFGGSGKFSPTGGMKWKKISWHKTQGPCCDLLFDGKIADSMYVDLTVNGWTFLRDGDVYKFDSDELGEKADPPTDLGPVPQDNRFPSLLEWKLLSEALGTRATRPDKLIQIDCEVRTYTEIVSQADHSKMEKRLCLDVIAHLCDEYDPRKARRWAANVELKRRAEYKRDAIAQDDAMPHYDEWMRWSFVFYTGIKDKRSALLVEIDSEVETYEELRGKGNLQFKKHLCLSILKNLCQGYHSQKVRRQLACDELKLCVDAELVRLGGAPEDTNMPDYDEWNSWSRVSHGVRGARSSELKMIDAEVRKHDALSDAGVAREAEIRICLNTILTLCDRYDTEKERRKAARDELVKRTQQALEWLTEDNKIPSRDDWKQWSKSSGRRPSQIRKIDDYLKDYWSTYPNPRQIFLNIIKTNCEMYSMSSNPDARRLSACDELKRQIDAILG